MKKLSIIAFAFALIGCVNVNNKAPVQPALLSIASLHGLDFGGVIIGNIRTYDLQITNVGSITASTVALQQIVAPFEVTTNTCGAEIKGGESCQISIGFRPGAVGPASLDILIEFFDGFTQQSITANLSGRGILAPVGEEIFGETDPEPSPSPEPSSSPEPSPEPSSSPEPSPSASPEPSPSTSPEPSPSSSPEPTVEPSPTPVVELASLSFSDGPLYNFGFVYAGQTASKTFTVTNNGLGTATNLNFVPLTAPFNISSTTCSGSLAPAATCTFTVQYSPSNSNGAVSNVVLAYINGVTNANATVSIQGSGKYHVLFATSTGYNGNLGGLSGGDAKCAARATAAGLTGTWKAVLSNSSTNAKDRLSITTKVYNRKGEKLASNAAGLWDGDIEEDVDYNEYGVEINGNEITWSGTFSNGTKSSDTCNNWTSSTNGNSYWGRVGQADRHDEDWISDTEKHCNQIYRIYCISQ